MNKLVSRAEHAALQAISHKATEAEAYIDRVASLILVAMTIDDYIHSCIVKRILHGQPHALVLLVVRNICSTCQNALSDSKL